MKIGIIGPEGSGKTSVFESLTGLSADAHGGRTTSLGVVQVPDERLIWLSEMYNPKKTTPAEITFMDRGGMSGEKLSAMTGALSDCDALAIVVGSFMGQNMADDFESYLLDLILADLSVVENRLERIDLDLNRGKKDSQAEKPLLLRLQERLNANQRLEGMEFSSDEEKALRTYQFVTQKPTLVVGNVGEDELGKEPFNALASAATAHNLQSFELCAPLEIEILQLGDEDRNEFLADYGLTASARERFVREAYKVTELISFFTVGPDEVRAWSIRRGTLAPRAAGKIHSDIEQGFIRAEVVAYEDLQTAGSHQECRTRGQVRLEGKAYEVKDGDIIEFRFSI